MRALTLLILFSSALAAPAGGEACTAAVARDDQEETMPSREAMTDSVSLLQAHVSELHFGISAHAGEMPSSRQELVSTARTSAAMLTTWQEAFEQDTALFDGCSKVFIDVGANRGTHVRKLFEPEKYPNSPYLAVFNESFGVSRSGPSSETGICAFGFEANPRWASTLKQIEKVYGAHGWRTRFFAPVAVSNKSGNVTFWLNDHWENSDWGASMVVKKPSAYARVVPAIDLSDFMQQLVAHAQPGFKLMKMDIEGAEFMVLPKLLASNMLCKSALDKLTIEWHDYALDTDERPTANSTRQQVMSPTKCGAQPATMVSAIDDESYRDDGMPLP